ncbi:MAG: Slp family lipoprotein [Nitrospira sp.]|nr:Slp family lipoprotein [Nitrospira sp.]MBS0166966.1 Slp family lipoprotein [Nitrospira sp.]
MSSNGSKTECAVSRMKPVPVATILLSSLLTLSLWGCGGIPRKYVNMAEPGLTLTAIDSDPDRYRGRVTILGGTIVEEEEREDQLFIRLTNRPLDQDYRPHRPIDLQGPEGGHYWVVVKGKIPRGYHNWARVTVVARVTGLRRHGQEPVFALLYVRGWGMNPAHDMAWEETIDANYLPSVPSSVGREYDPSR